VVLLPQHPQVNDALGREIMDRNAVAVSAVRNMPPQTPDAEKFSRDEHQPPLGLNRFTLEVLGQQIRVESPLLGRHQLRNLALAITAAEQLNKCGFRVEARQIEVGIRSTRWLGRFQVIPAENGNPETVLDVAHNPAGAWALRSALSTFYEDRRLTLVFGAMRDKAIGEIAGILFPLAGLVVATRAANPRAASPQEIAEIGKQSGTEVVTEETVSSALDRARLLAGSGGVVVITGSIYIVGEALGLLAQTPVRSA
jgi:dihydrofolate synthase/folylpolyglutamate synthase